jgi:hypothetical protein
MYRKKNIFSICQQRRKAKIIFQKFNCSLLLTFERFIKQRTKHDKPKTTTVSSQVLSIEKGSLAPNSVCSNMPRLMKTSQREQNQWN